MARRTIVMALLGSTLAAGCGAQGFLLGAHGKYLFQAYDAMSLPGEEVTLRTRLQGGNLLRGRPGHNVRFLTGGQVFATAVTNEDGYAEVTFTPAKPLDYVFSAELDPKGFEDGDEPPPPAELLLACRKADEPLVIVDLDKTVVASGFHTVLLGDPEPMPESPRVMSRLARQFTVVYLTHRPDLFGIKSKGWLKAKGFPRAPLLLSDVSGFMEGSGAFKTAAIRKLQERFGNLKAGIGDKISDAKAYHDCGVRSLLIIQPEKLSDADDFEDLAGDIEKGLPEQVEVVTGWDQVERAVFEKTPYRRNAMLKTLRDIAGRLKKEEDERKRRKDDDD